MKNVQSHPKPADLLGPLAGISRGVHIFEHPEFAFHKIYSIHPSITKIYSQTDDAIHG